MRTSLAELLEFARPLLCDGATGTNYFERGLGPGEPPEFWNLDHPDRVRLLHQEFVDAGADMILTNTFGCNRYRLKLHAAESRTAEIAFQAALIASDVAARATRPVLVAGSMGPTGELLVPLGPVTEDEATEAFRELAQALKDGGADLAWIETKSAISEMRAAARAAIDVGLPYAVTCSFDTAGRTMMGLAPADLADVFEGLVQAPVALGANCGVGAADLIAAIQQMVGASTVLIAKSNCGVPRFRGAEIEYTGNPQLMGRYAALAVDSGATIIGGCCGTSPDHLRVMRTALDAHVRGDVPTLETIIDQLGPLTNTIASPGDPGEGRRVNRRRSS